MAERLSEVLAAHEGRLSWSGVTSWNAECLGCGWIEQGAHGGGVVAAAAHREHLAAALESAVAARLAPIEALAEELHERAQACTNTTEASLARRAVYLSCAADLRATLAASRPVHPAGDEGRQG